MTVLVFGESGQVARALSRKVSGASFVGRNRLDLSHPDGIRALIEAERPYAVINAAAYTAVDNAEQQEQLATTINGTAPGIMAQTCAMLDVPFIHISTDYVFDGQGDTPHAPDAPTGPLGAYGRSKLAGEIAVRAAGGRGVILRTSAVFSAEGSNFVKTMIRLGETRDALNVVADQITGPTPADAIALATLDIAEQLAIDAAKAGTYHLAGAPFVTWADFARAVFAASGQPVTVNDIPTSAYPMPAKRPANAKLDCTTLDTTFGIARPDWESALNHTVAQIKKAMT